MGCRAGMEVIEEPLKKKEMAEWRKGRRREYFILFLKKGFTNGAEEMRREKEIVVFELRDLSR